MNIEDLLPKPKKQTLTIEQKIQNAIRNVWAGGISLDRIINNVLAVVPEADIYLVEKMVKIQNARIAAENAKIKADLAPFYKAAMNVFK